MQTFLFLLNCLSAYDIDISFIKHSRPVGLVQWYYPSIPFKNKPDQLTHKMLFSSRNKWYAATPTEVMVIRGKKEMCDNDMQGKLQYMEMNVKQNT